MISDSKNWVFLINLDLSFVHFNQFQPYLSSHRKVNVVQWKYGAFWSNHDLGYIRHFFCVSGRIYDTYHKSVGCHAGTLGEFFLFTKIQDGRQPLYSKKLTIHFWICVEEQKKNSITAVSDHIQNLVWKNW